MKRCPTCKVKYVGKRACHRCKMDLSTLLDIEKQAEEHQKETIAAFNKGDFNNMFLHAKRSWSLLRTPESAGLMAAASLLTKNFELSLSLWQFKE